MRKKLRLDLNELAVETFTTTRPDAARGTIKGYSGECGSSGFMFCACDDSPADNTFVNRTCETGAQDYCFCHGYGG